MASTTQKKTTTQKSSTSKSSASRSGSSRSKKPAQPQKRPIRREVGGVVLLVLALFAAVSYFGVSAIFIDWFAALLKGLFGYGYWLAAPAMLLASLILLFHHGRPVQLRTTCALLLPVLLGTLGHLLSCKEEFASSLGVLPKLWTSGNALSSGGAVSGALAVGSAAVFSRLASIIIFTVLFVVLLMVALRLTVGALIEKHRERPRYEEEPEQPHVRVVPLETPSRRTEESRPQIDIPLDDEPVKKAAVQVQAQKEGRFTSFFRHKSDQQKTPDQVLREKAEKKPAFTPAIPAASAPAAEPVKAVVPPSSPVAAAETPKPVQAPAPAPIQEEPASARKEKATTAKEVAAQTAAVTAEIEQKLATEEDAYQFPPITLLKASQGENHVEAGAELRNNSRRLADTLTSFGVDATPGDVVHGPSVTRYEFVLDQGVKLSKIKAQF